MTRRKCGCPEQHKGMWCPACAGTGSIPPPEPLTEADHVARANHWGFAYATGYLDGLRDKLAKVASPIPRLEMTDYAQGYWKARGKG